MRISTLALAFLSLVPRAAAYQGATWIVDANNGPGAQFTTIDTAIGVAAPNDVIVVRSGSYFDFSLSKAVRIIGEAGTLPYISSANVYGIQAGGVAALAGLHLNYLTLNGSAGSVVVVDSILKGVTANSCSDVRIQRSKVHRGVFAGVGADAVSAVSSRLEIVSCDVRGGDAYQGTSCVYGGTLRGGTAIACGVGSRVHIADSLIEGGTGSRPLMCGIGFPELAGNGGPGVEIADGAELVEVGCEIHGGAPGDIGGLVGWEGASGVDCAVADFGALRYSSNTFVIDAPTSTVVHAIPADPLLTLSAFAQPPVSPISLALNGNVGFNGRMQQGSTTRVYDDGQCEIELLASRTRLHPLGPFPPSEMLNLNIWVPGDAHPGWLRVFQGIEIIPTTQGAFERTNSVIYVLR